MVEKGLMIRWGGGSFPRGGGVGMDAKIDCKPIFK